MSVATPRQDCSKPIQHKGFMYTQSAHIYDAVYTAVGKDYAAESDKLHAIIQRRKRSPGNRLLDVACGTGRHLEHLQANYQVEGLDLEPLMIELARKRLPEVYFRQGDMAAFELEAVFDVVVCLFSAIGYVRTEARLRQAVANMARHLAPGGVLIVEPWIAPQDFRTGTVHATFLDEPELKIARMNVSRREGNLAVMNMHFMVGTPEQIEYFTELHELAMFEEQAYLAAFQDAGLAVTYDEEGLIGRGLYVGVRQAG